MDSDSTNYYENYSPPPQIEKRLGSATEDNQRKAPLRDLLGILEKNEAWSQESSLTAGEVKENLEEWDENHRTRPITPPETTKTIRNGFEELHNNNLVFKKKSENSNEIRYWKLKDTDLLPFWQYKIIHRVFIQPVLIADDVILKNILLKNYFTRICIYSSVISSLLYLFNIEILGVNLGYQAAILAIISLVFGLTIYPLVASSEMRNVAKE